MQTHPVSRTLLFALFFLSCLLAGCGGSEESGEKLSPEEAETRRVVDEYVCTDEHEAALAFTGPGGMVAQWNGTPFVVDVSDHFTNADQLLGIVAAEAARIHAALGYEVFVAGDVLPLEYIGLKEQWLPPDVEAQLTPPDQHVALYCCAAHAVAFPWSRFAVLSGRYDTTPGQWNLPLLEADARYSIIHELYHIPGFDHPGSWSGVEMSHDLSYGPLAPAGSSRNRQDTRSTAVDLAKLACIFDEGATNAS